MVLNKKGKVREEARPLAEELARISNVERSVRGPKFIDGKKDNRDTHGRTNQGNNRRIPALFITEIVNSMFRAMKSGSLPTPHFR